MLQHQKESRKKELRLAENATDDNDDFLAHIGFEDQLVYIIFAN
jgi:hypothetical protein